MADYIQDFKDNCKALGIEQYTDRIFGASSTGELSHLDDYRVIRELVESHEGLTESFPRFFDMVVVWVEANWKRPDSVFLHMPRILRGEG